MATDCHPSTFHTTFLIPNLHCPSCTTSIQVLLNDLHPSATVLNVSFFSHSLTVQHDSHLSALDILHALSDSGYEIFDVILDAASPEKLQLSSTRDGTMSDAVGRWEPQRTAATAAAREKHQQYCHMCAGYGAHVDGAALDEVIAVQSEAMQNFSATISIEGMTCSSCVGNVQRALEGLPSVSRADVSLVNHSATVHYASSTPDEDAQRLVDAVEDAGYGGEIVEMKPDRQPTSKSDDQMDVLWNVEYAISGMTCASCVTAISTAVKQLSFVERMEINLIQHSGTVTFRGQQNASAIKETIEDAGYEATQMTLRKLEQVKSTTSSSSRTVILSVGGMWCPNCPERLSSALQTMPVEVTKMPTLESPVLTISYIPSAPEFTVRSIISTLKNLDAKFTVSIHKPPTLEERSRQMLRKESRAILIRTVFTIFVAIPTFIIGIVYMTLVKSSDPGARYLMSPLHGVSRAEWALFLMATPVFVFATDYFHRRTIKEIYSTWRPRSKVPLLRRFYRFGSMNMLISLGTTVAYCASLAELIVKATMPITLTHNSQSGYFDSVVFLTMFLLLGRYAEARMKAKSGDAVTALGNLRPTEALLQTSKEKTNGFENVNVDLVDVGDIVKVLHGSSPPCDGTLLDPTASIDESSLSGESVLVLKQTGDTVFSGTINKGNAISIRVTKYAGDSMLDSIIRIVRDGQSKRAPVERIADVLTAYFVPVVVLLAIITWVIWLALGLSGTLPRNYLDTSIGGWPFWSLQFSIAVFVIACPCGLGLAAPTALIIGGGVAAKKGILVKGGGEAFQEASGLDAVVFDKTGTLTQGAEPVIVHHALYADSSLSEEEILGVLKAVEENSSHPLGKAAVAFVDAQQSVAVNTISTEELPGKGMRASFNLAQSESFTRHEALIGNENLMQDRNINISGEARELLECWKAEGNSIIISAIRSGEVKSQWRITAIFAAADAIREEAAEVIASLQDRKIDVWMLSGDNPTTASAVAAKVGIPPTNVIAGVLPAEKAEKITYLQQSLRPLRNKGWAARLIRNRTRATIAMVGDGINDAPALAAADVGIAVASGSDVAVQSAAFILVHSDLRAILTLTTLSRTVFQRVLLNFFWAGIYNMIAVPVAAGVLYPVRASGGHVRLDPAWAALAMALSSITVVGSSLLLRTKLPLVGFRG